MYVPGWRGRDPNQKVRKLTKNERKKLDAYLKAKSRQTRQGCIGLVVGGVGATLLYSLIVAVVPAFAQSVARGTFVFLALVIVVIWASLPDIRQQMRKMNTPFMALFGALLGTFTTAIGSAFLIRNNLPQDNRDAGMAITGLIVGVITFWALYGALTVGIKQTLADLGRILMLPLTVLRRNRAEEAAKHDPALIASENAMRRAEYTPAEDAPEVVDIGIVTEQELYRGRQIPADVKTVQPSITLESPQRLENQRLIFEVFDNDNVLRHTQVAGVTLREGETEIRMPKPLRLADLNDSTLSGSWTILIRLNELPVAIHRFRLSLTHEIIAREGITADGEISARLARLMDDDKETEISLAELLNGEKKTQHKH
ncbi:hypothetical protein ANRL4_05039 [Anaerolineae bacterium]|nr:hypothetical protein ANRL4_05039 [Anaerolineae bacterium]